MPVRVQELLARLQADVLVSGAAEGQPSAVSSSIEAGNRDRGGKAECRSAAMHFGKHPEAGWPQEVRSDMQYLVVIERGPTSFGAYVPDLPGCVAVGEPQQEVEHLIREAIEFHIEGLRGDGQAVPEPNSTPQLVSGDA